MFCHVNDEHLPCSILRQERSHAAPAFSKLASTMPRTFGTSKESIGISDGRDAGLYWFSELSDTTFEHGIVPCKTLISRVSLVTQFFDHFCLQRCRSHISVGAWKLQALMFDWVFDHFAESRARPESRRDWDCI